MWNQSTDTYIDDNIYLGEILPEVTVYAPKSHVKQKDEVKKENPEEYSVAKELAKGWGNTLDQAIDVLQEPVVWDIIKAIDPTGILSYPDVIKAYKEVKEDPSASNYANLVWQGIGALPMFGKVKLLSLGARSMPRTAKMLYNALDRITPVDNFFTRPTNSVLLQIPQKFIQYATKPFNYWATHANPYSSFYPYMEAIPQGLNALNTTQDASDALIDAFNLYNEIKSDLSNDSIKGF